MNDRKATARSGRTQDGVREYGLVIKSSAVNVDETDLAAEGAGERSLIQRLADRMMARRIGTLKLVHRS